MEVFKYTFKVLWVGKLRWVLESCTIYPVTDSCQCMCDLVHSGRMGGEGIAQRAFAFRYKLIFSKIFFQILLLLRGMCL